jgi:hypothetical protein
MFGATKTLSRSRPDLKARGTKLDRGDKWHLRFSTPASLWARDRETGHRGQRESTHTQTTPQHRPKSAASLQTPSISFREFDSRPSTADHLR